MGLTTSFPDDPSPKAWRAHLPQGAPLPRASTRCGRPDVRLARRRPREVDVLRPPSFATITLPTSTWRATRWPHVRSVSISPSPRRATGSQIPAPTRQAPFHVRCAPTRAPSRIPSNGPRPPMVIPPAQVESSAGPVPTRLFISCGSGITPVMSMLRSLQRAAPARHFPPLRPYPEHQIFAESSTRSAAPATASTCTCCPDLGDPNCPVLLDAWCPATRRAAWACARPVIEPSCGVRGSDALSVEYSSRRGLRKSQRTSPSQAGWRPQHWPPLLSRRCSRVPPRSAADGHLLRVHGCQEDASYATSFREDPPRRKTNRVCVSAPVACG